MRWYPKQGQFTGYIEGGLDETEEARRTLLDLVLPYSITVPHYILAERQQMFKKPGIKGNNDPKWASIMDAFGIRV